MYSKCTVCRDMSRNAGNGENVKLDDISPKVEIQLNRLKLEKGTNRAANLTNLANMAIVTIFRQS